MSRTAAPVRAGCRPAIDGLRAVAMLSVIGFHASARPLLLLVTVWIVGRLEFSADERRSRRRRAVRSARGCLTDPAHDCRGALMPFDRRHLTSTASDHMGQTTVAALLMALPGRPLAKPE